MLNLYVFINIYSMNFKMKDLLGKKINYCLLFLFNLFANVYHLKMYSQQCILIAVYYERKPLHCIPILSIPYVLYFPNISLITSNNLFT